MGEKIALVLKVLLENKNKWLTAKEIIALLEEDGYSFNRKEVMKIIHIINEFTLTMHGYEMIEGKRKVGYAIDRDYFEDGELQLLLDLVFFNRDACANEKRALLKKISSLSSTRQLSRLTLDTLKEDKKYGIILSLTTITHAIDEKRNIIFNYVDYGIENGHPAERNAKRGNRGIKKEDYLVSPYRIFMNNGHYYLIGYFDQHPDQLTTYRIDRMRRVRSSRSAYEDHTEQYDFTAYMQQHFNMYGNGELLTLSIRFDRTLLREVVSRFGMNITLEQQGSWYKGEAEDIAMNEGLRQWIMQFGNKMHVISPAKLKDSIKKELQRTLAEY